MRKIIIPLLLLSLFSVPRQSKAQSLDLLKEYLFPIESSEVIKADLIGLRIYKNKENKGARQWYQDNVANPSAGLLEVTVDGYRGVKDNRSVYIQAGNVVVNSDPDKTSPDFYTNIYVLAYNQNAAPETVQIFNSMLKNLKFNKNILGIYCLEKQTEIIKDKIRRDTLRKADFYKVKNIFSNFSGTLNLQAGTYVPNMSISTWPSWKDTLSKQLGVELPVDPLNIMARTAIKCIVNEDCGQGQCSGGYCSQCPEGYDPKTCWNEREKKYFDVDGYIYRFKSGQIAFRYEYLEIVLPATGGERCILGCLKNEVFYEQGRCISKDGVKCNATNCFCDAGSWQPNYCGDGLVRCGEGCDYLAGQDPDKRCISCKSCRTNYHAIGGKCEPDTKDVEVTQSLSVKEQTVWQGDDWSEAFATECVANAIINSKGVCVCKEGYHESNGNCSTSSKTYNCQPLQSGAYMYNSVSSYDQKWVNNVWFPEDDPITEFNLSASSTSCQFKCKSGYVWDGNICNCPNDYHIDEDNCLPNTKIFSCEDNFDLPQNTKWWLPLYTQRWTGGTSYLPAEDTQAEYQETSLTSDCANDQSCNCVFSCINPEQYTWNGSECEIVL
ncbi:MAG: hypothetical protein NTZ49_05385 [Candidatus Parcubacteria bacterium]|nr:hypothetical protein [Candidatus Parcubacteria bacterium]